MENVSMVLCGDIDGLWDNFSVYNSWLKQNHLNKYLNCIGKAVCVIHELQGMCVFKGGIVLWRWRKV